MRDLIAYALYSLVGLGGLLLVFSVFSGIEDESHVEQLNTELMSFVTGIRKVHRGHPDLYGTAVITDVSLIQSRIAPTTTVAGTVLRNSFGGDITITGVANATFTIDYENVPQEVCIQALARLRPDRRVLDARIAPGTAGLAAATAQTFPVSFSDASANCSAAENAIRITAR